MSNQILAGTKPSAQCATTERNAAVDTVAVAPLGGSALWGASSGAPSHIGADEVLVMDSRAARSGPARHTLSVICITVNEVLEGESPRPSGAEFGVIPRVL